MSATGPRDPAPACPFCKDPPPAPHPLFSTGACRCKRLQTHPDGTWVLFMSSVPNGGADVIGGRDGTWRVGAREPMGPGGLEEALATATAHVVMES